MNPAAKKAVGKDGLGGRPLGVTLFKFPYSSGKGYQILPAYARDEILLTRVFQGYTDSAVFTKFTE